MSTLVPEKTLILNDVQGGSNRQLESHRSTKAEKEVQLLAAAPSSEAIF